MRLLLIFLYSNYSALYFYSFSVKNPYGSYGNPPNFSTRLPRIRAFAAPPVRRRADMRY